MAKKRKKHTQKHSQNQTEQEFMGEIQLSYEQSDEKSNELVHEEEPSENNHSAESHQEQKTQQPEQSEVLETPSFHGTLGEYLKQEREKRNIKIADISLSTRISIPNLEYLENNDFQSLPNRAYVRGYIKNYTKFIGIDDSYALELFDNDYPPLHGKKADYQITKEDYSDEQEVNWKLILIILISIIVAAVAFFSYRIFSQRKQTQVENSIETKQLQVEEVKKETNKIMAKSLDAETPLEKEAEKVAPQNKVVENKPSEEVKKIVKEEAKPIKEEKEKKEDEKKINFFPVPQPLYTISEDPEDFKLLPSQFKNSTVSGQQNVIVSAHKSDTWLTYKVDEQDIKKYVLKKGQFVLLRGKLVRLFLGNIGAGTVFLNEKPLILKSRSGVKSLVFPQSEAKNYVLPLFIYDKKTGGVVTSEQYRKENPED